MFCWFLLNKNAHALSAFDPELDMASCDCHTKPTFLQVETIIVLHSVRYLEI